MATNVIASKAPRLISKDAESLHAKRPAFRWIKQSDKTSPLGIPSAAGRSDAALCGARRSSLFYSVTSGTIPAGAGLRTGGNALLRQTSLPAKPGSLDDKVSLSELKSILKRSRCFSEAPCESVSDSESYGSISPTNFDFFYEFRSTDEIFTEGSEGDWKKRVSFSEKIQKNTYRPGTCILQQKQKAQKRKEKRSKDKRRTASESDVSDLTHAATTFSELSLWRNAEYDSGVEGEVFSPSLEEVAEASEEDLPEPGPDAKQKPRKKRNHKNKKPK